MTRPHRTPLLALATLALLFAAPPGARADDAPAADAAAKLGPETRDYDMVHLDLTVDLDVEAGAIKGRAVHTMTSLRDGLDVVRLHLEDMDVSAVAADGVPAKSFERKDGVLSITLDRPRKKDEPLTLAIDYGGKPTSGLWFFHPTAEHPDIPTQVWSQGEGTENRHWIPVYDLPDDRLTSSLTLTLPRDMESLSNGVETVTDVEGDPSRTTRTWRLDRPHPAYLITLVVGDFDVVERDAAGVQQYDFVPPGWGPWCDEVFGRTPSMMAFYQDYTGQPYPWPRYSQVTVWDFQWGGMENTGATTLNMRALHKEGVRPDYSADGLVAHELAHQWFGDLVTCRTFNHMWLNEGFATYFTDLWTESHEGADQFAFDRRDSMDGYLGNVDLDAVARAEPPAGATECGDLEHNAYTKGSSVLHMLRNLLGAGVFKDGIRRYVRETRDKSVDSEALRAALEAESGKNLSWFFDQWVYGSGVPRLSVTHRYDGKAGELLVTVEQTQPVTATRPLFRTPVDVELTWDGGAEETHRFELFQQRHVWRIPVKSRPATVVFDPDDWLLAKVERKQSVAEWSRILTSSRRTIARARACRALGALGAPAVEALAKAAAEQPWYGVRSAAAKALGEIGGRRAGAALCAAAEDQDSRVRTAALEALGEIAAPWSAATLERHALEDTSVYAAAAAAESLGKTKAAGALATLTKALTRESHRDVIRRRVMEGLRALGDPRALDLALRYLDYSNGKGIQHRLRQAALETVVALAPHDERTHAALTRLVEDPYFRMRNAAAGDAAKLGVEDAIPGLERSAETGLGPGVREAAKKALAKLKPTAPAAEDGGDAPR